MKLRHHAKACAVTSRDEIRLLSVDELLRKIQLFRCHRPKVGAAYPTAHSPGAGNAAAMTDGVDEARMGAT